MQCDDPSYRYVLLPDCGHSIEEEYLQHWLETHARPLSEYDEIDGEQRAFRLPACILCKAPIKSLRRFWRLLQQPLRDLEKIKEMSMRQEQEIIQAARDACEAAEKLQREIRAIINPQPAAAAAPVAAVAGAEPAEKPKERACNGRQREYVGTLLMAAEPEKICGRLLQDLQAKRRPDSVQILATQFAVNSYRQLCRWLDKDFDRLEGENLYDGVMSELQQMQALIQQHCKAISDIAVAKDAEKSAEERRNRVSLEVLSLRLRLSLLYDPSSRETRAAVLETVQGELQRTGAIERAAVLILRKKVDELCGRVPIDVSLLRLVESQAGHVFMCPNRHPYIIADCGGAMMESKCADCGAAIGGGSHQLRADNRYARELEQRGAGPAWPTMGMHQ